jgi:D-glycero-alpha-D-manno-heptose-7-phosphate kinase
VIRSRAPLRLSLAGGGTDLSPFCDQHNGAVLNCTIDRYAYAFVDRSNHQVIFRARDLKLEERHEPGALLDASEGLRLHRAAYNHFFEQAGWQEDRSLILTTSVDAPPGSGLGSSSALVVAICEALSTAFNVPLGLYDLAHLAFRVERINLGLAGGKQDQYAAAFGGINFIEFLANDRVIVNPLRVERAIINELEASLVICFTGASRDSDFIIRQQTANIVAGNETALAGLFELKTTAAEMKQAMLLGDIPAIGEILNRSWTAKKQTSDAVASDLIEKLIEIGRNAGAKGAKVSGAGGGGFIMYLVNPEDRVAVIDALTCGGGRAGPVHLTSQGVESWRQPKTRGSSVRELNRDTGVAQVSSLGDQQIYTPSAF